MILYRHFGVTLQSDRGSTEFLFFFFLHSGGQERSVPVKPGRKAIYHLPVVFGTLFFCPLNIFLLFIYQSWLWLLIGIEITYTPLKYNTLVYNPLSDKQYLYPPEFVPLLPNTQKTVYDLAGNAYFPLSL